MNENCSQTLRFSCDRVIIEYGECISECSVIRLPEKGLAPMSAEFSHDGTSVKVRWLVRTRCYTWSILISVSLLSIVLERCKAISMAYALSDRGSVADRLEVSEMS